MSTVSPFQARFVLVTLTDEPVTKEYGFANARERDAYLMGVRDGVGTKHLTKLEVIDNKPSCVRCGDVANVCVEGVWLCARHDTPVNAAIGKILKEEHDGS